MADQLTDKEKAALTKFTALVGDVRHVHHTDRDMARWLQAKGWNPKKADEMYRENLKWRESMGADRLLAEFTEPEVMTLYYAGGIVGKDKDGNIIRVDPSGRNDVKGLLRSVKKDELHRTIVWRFEKTLADLRDWRETHGGPADQVIQVMDMEGFTSAVSDMSVVHFYLDTMKILDNHYPGLIKKSYIVNAPSVFKMAWNFMKRFLNKETTDRFMICDGNGRDQLVAEIPVDQLPAAYGGTLTDPDGDPACKTLINYGGEVPASYHRTVDTCISRDEAITNHVGRADVLKVEAKVGQVPATLRWVFATEGNPIKYGIYREGSGARQDGPRGKDSVLGTLEEVVAMREVDSHVVPEDGTVACQVPGTYFLIFDNRSSRFTRRKVIYQFNVESGEAL